MSNSIIVGYAISCPVEDAEQFNLTSEIVSSDINLVPQVSVKYTGEISNLRKLYKHWSRGSEHDDDYVNELFNALVE